MRRSTFLAPALLLTFAWTLPAQEYTPFGPGCPGSVGIPFLGTAEGSTPRLGENLTLRLSNVPDNDGFIAFGFSTTSWFGIPLPLDLGQFGLFGCTLYMSAEGSLPVTASAGFGEITFPIPPNANLLGVTFYNQAFILDPGVNPFAGGGVLSNAACAVIGEEVASPTFDLSGTWDVTELFGVIGECVAAPAMLNYSVVTTQNGNNLDAVFPDRSAIWTVSGTDVGWTGSFPAMGGTMTITSSSLVATDASTISGTVDWAWTLDGSSFCYGTNNITATKQ